MDEACDLYSRLASRSRMERMGRAQPFEWRARLVALGPLTLWTHWQRGDMRGITDEVLEDIFTLAFPLKAARGETLVDGEAVPLVGGRAALVASPRLPIDMRLASGYRAVMVVVKRATMEATLDALTGKPRRAPLRFEPRLPIASGVGASLLRLVQYLIAEAEQDESFFDSPLIAARFADVILYRALWGQSHNHSALLRAPTRAAEPGHVRKVAEYLDAHAAEPVRLAELAAVAGVSVRAVQAGFRAHRGCSPMAFLRERRFALARTRLLSAAGPTVTQIAHDCGFEHLGRFSVDYRERFGESPAGTLRRARQG